MLLACHTTGAWQVVNSGGTGSESVIGQSFRPSAQGSGDPFFLPRAANGLAFLQFLEFDIAAGASYPQEIYFFSSPPFVNNGIVSSDGAFAVGQLSGNVYEFDPPLPLPYNELTFIVFPSCVRVPINGGSYSGGQNLIPQGGCSFLPTSGPVVSGAFDINFSALFANPVAPLAADYRINDKTLGSFKAGAPDLTDLGSNAFIPDLVFGQERNVLDIVSGTGLQLNLKELLSQDSYSMVLLLRIDTNEGARRLIDLSGLTEDTGLYVDDKVLLYRGDPNLPGRATVDEDTYVQVSLIREQPTQFSVRQAEGVVGDETAFSFTDNSGIALPANGTAHFLRDDGNENTGGAIARIRIFDGDLTTQEARTLEPLPPVNEDLYEPDNTPFTADVGLSTGRLSSYRTFHEDQDIDWIYVGDPCYSGNYYSTQGALHFHSDDPRFQPIVEVYGDSYLTDTSAPPIAVYGACGQAGNVQFFAPPGHFSIRNCPDVDLSGGPVSYTLTRLRPDMAVCGPISTIEGRVIDADTGAPVGGQFILGNGSSTAVSNPASGQYSLAVTAGVMNLEVVSPDWQGPPVELETMPLVSYENIDLLVTSTAPPDDMPVAADDAFDGTEDVLLTGTVAGNDTLSADGGNVFSLLTGATRGAATVNSDGSFEYLPNLNVSGADSFRYRLTDGDGDFDQATVSLTLAAVNDSPVAAPDGVSLDADSPPTSVDVLANDSDVDSATLTVSAVTQPVNGTTAVAPDGASVTYEPSPGYCNNGAAPDTFSYTVSDGAASAQGTVEVTVFCTAERVFSNGFED